jgi:hypothetical protein
MMSVAIWVATRADSAAATYLFTGMLGFGSAAPFLMGVLYDLHGSHSSAPVTELSR